MKKKNLNVVEEVKEVEETIEETVEEKTEVAEVEVKKEGMLKRAGKAVGGGIKKYGKKALVGAGLLVTGVAVGAIAAYKKYGSDETGCDAIYDGDVEVIDLEPSDYTETSYEESVEE